MLCGLNFWKPSAIMMKKLLLPFCIMLNACVPTTPQEPVSRADMEITGAFVLNPFPVAPPTTLSVSNKDLASDFLDLTFQLETGKALPVFTRFEGPISVAIHGRIPAPLPAELNRLINRLRSEADIDIFQTKSKTANINIHAISRLDIKSTFPTAACCVAPNVTSLREFKRLRKTEVTSWSRQTTRSLVSIFLPSDAAPQEIRDCLHEEFAQSLAPLNDMYRLPNSVFNDDNIHTILTTFDTTVLKIAYAPELRSGMTRQEVAARLPSLLSRLNPRGDQIPARNAVPTSRAWNMAISQALGPGTAAQDRPSAARRAISLAREANYNDHRLGFSYFAMGRVIQHNAPQTALDMFQIAHNIFVNAPKAELYAAHTATQLAAHNIAVGQGEKALLILAPYLDVAYDNENASLLSTLMLLRAEALELTGHASEARKVRLDSLTWARYGFGSENYLRSKLREINALNPLNRKNG